MCVSNHFGHHAKPPLQVFCRVNGSTSSAAMVLAKYSGPHETRHRHQQLFSIRHQSPKHSRSQSAKVYHVQSSFLLLLRPFSSGLLCPLADATTNLAPQASMEELRIAHPSSHLRRALPRVSAGNISHSWVWRHGYQRYIVSFETHLAMLGRSLQGWLFAAQML